MAGGGPGSAGAPTAGMPHVVTPSSGMPKDQTAGPDTSRREHPCQSAIKVCPSPAQLLHDVKQLSYVSRGATSIVFKGLWQGALVAVKFMCTQPHANSPCMREAELAQTLVHPHVVQSYAVRCAMLTAAFYVQTLGPTTDSSLDEMAHRAVFSATHISVEGGATSSIGAAPTDGTLPLQMDPTDACSGPADNLPTALQGPQQQPSTPSETQETTAEPAIGAVAAAAAIQVTAAGAAAAHEDCTMPVDPTQDFVLDPAQERQDEAAGAQHNPWTEGLSWALVLKALQAEPGQMLVVAFSEFGELGTLAKVIHHGTMLNLRTTDTEQLCFSLRAILRTARELALALDYMHSLHVVHADFKPDNVVLFSSQLDARGFSAKITDFGFARMLPRGMAPATPAAPAASSSGQPSTPQHSKAAAMQDADLVNEDVDWGTTIYMAPEHFAGTLCLASDVYSFGVTLWEMCHAVRPWSSLQRGQISQGVLTGSIRLLWSAPAPAPMVDLVARCLQHNPDHRPSAAQLVTELADLEQFVMAYAHEQLRSVQLGPARQPLPLQQLAEQGTAAAQASTRHQGHVQQAAQAAASGNVMFARPVEGEQPSTMQQVAQAAAVAAEFARQAADAAATATHYAQQAEAAAATAVRVAREAAAGTAAESSHPAQDDPQVVRPAWGEATGRVLTAEVEHAQVMYDQQAGAVGSSQSRQQEGMQGHNSMRQQGSGGGQAGAGSVAASSFTPPQHPPAAPNTGGSQPTAGVHAGLRQVPAYAAHARHARGSGDEHDNIDTFELPRAFTSPSFAALLGIPSPHVNPYLPPRIPTMQAPVNLPPEAFLAPRPPPAPPLNEEALPSALRNPEPASGDAASSGTGLSELYDQLANIALAVDEHLQLAVTDAVYRSGPVEASPTGMSSMPHLEDESVGNADTRAGTDVQPAYNQER